MNELLIQTFANDGAVVTSDLVKDFRTSRALDEVSLSVPTGAVYLLVGPNGAGKTTLLRTLLDQLRPTSGSVEVLGHNPSRDGAWVRAAMGYVPESGMPVYRWMKVGELLKFHAAYYSTWDAAYADKLVNSLGIKLDVPFGTLSKGEGRRVQLVMALAHRPPLLLFDEPTDGLDPVIRDRFFAVLAEHLAENETTVLMSSHLVYESELFADHLGVLNHGKLQAQIDRPTLDANLRRYIGNVPNGSMIDAGFEDRLLHSRQSCGGSEWTVWGDENNVRDQLSKAGVHVSDVRRLSLEETARVLMEVTV